MCFLIIVEQRVNMNAQDMFKNIKYRETRNELWVRFHSENAQWIDYHLYSDDCEYGKKQHEYTFRFDKFKKLLFIWGTAIFDINQKSFTKDNYKTNIHSRFHQAIHQQMIELGWL